MFEIIFSIFLVAAPGDVSITWANYSNGAWDIYLHDSPSGTIRLTESTADEYYPRFSPDGKRIYFVRHDNGKHSIHRMTLDGKEDGWEIDDAEYFSLIDSSKIIYESHGKRWVIKWLDLETGEVSIDPLSSMPVFNRSLMAQPDSSPDGETVYILSNRRGWSIERISKKEKKASQIGRGCRPTVSRDGKLMAYVSNRGNGGSSIKIINSNSGDEVKTIDLPGQLSHEYDPKFSNDGKWLIFSVCPNDQHDPKRGAEYQLYLYKWGASGAPKPLLDLPGADWYPDIFIEK